MKALVKYKKGTGNVKIMDVEVPLIGTDEVLIRVEAVGICGTDLHILQDDSYPVNPPVILGHEVSGIIEKVGEDVNNWHAGDEVISETYYHTCGHCFYCKTGNINLCEEKLSIGSGVNGAMAEFIKVPAKNLHKKPINLTFEEACMTEPTTCCVQAVLQHGNLKPDNYVVISGPGTIGLITLQIVKLYGCKVIFLGTEKDEERLAMAKKFGADYTMYVEDTEIVQKVKNICGGIGADSIFECSGSVHAIALDFNLLRKGGFYTQIGIPGKKATIDMGQLVLREYHVNGTYATRPVWWDTTIRLLEEGKIQLKPLQGEPYALDDWEKAFADAKNGIGYKHIIKPTN